MGCSNSASTATSQPLGQNRDRQGGPRHEQLASTEPAGAALGAGQYPVAEQLIKPRARAVPVQL